MATKGIPSVPDVPSQLTEDDIYRILDPLKRIIDIRQGRFDPLDRWVTQQDLIDAGLQTVTAATSPITIVPPTSEYDFELIGDINGGPTEMASGDPLIQMSTIINLPNVTGIDGSDAAETYPGSSQGPYGVGGVGGGLPAGGTAGQIIVKQSAADNDADWQNPGPQQANEAYCPGYSSYTRVDDNEFTVDLVNAENLFYVGRRVRFDKAGVLDYGVINAVDFNITSANDTHVTLTMEGADTVPTGTFDVCLVSSATAWSPIAEDPFSGGNIRDIATGNIGGTQYWVIVGDAGKVAYSTNSGVSWTTATSGTTSTLYACIYDTNNQKFWIGGVDSADNSPFMAYSTNGSTWTGVTPPDTVIGNYVVDMCAMSNESSLICSIFDSVSVFYDTYISSTEWTTSIARGTANGSGLVAADETATSGSNVWGYGSGTNYLWYSAFSDTSSTSGGTVTGTITALMHTPVSGVGAQVFIGSGAGHVEYGIPTNANVLDDVTFGNSINDFAHSELHARTVCVGNGGQIGYIDDADVASLLADAWTSVSNGFDPAAVINAVEFNEVNGVFVAVSSNGQICRSSNGTS